MRVTPAGTAKESGTAGIDDAIGALRARLSKLPFICGPLVAVPLIALASWLLIPAYFPSWDFAQAVATGQDILAGRENGYALPGFAAPLPHPLGVLIGVVAAGFGSHAFAFLDVLGALFFGLLVWSVFELGRKCFSWPVGLLAALLVFSAWNILGLAVRDSNDIKFAALVMVAAVVEAHRPKRGWAVLGLLAFAGFLRPEAWILSFLYWAYLFRGSSWPRRAGLAALVVAGPALWALSDLLLTGDALYSRHHSQHYVEDGGGGRHTTPIRGIPRSIYESIAQLVSSPVVWGSPVGLALAAASERRRRAVLPFAVGAATTAAIAVLMAAGSASFFRFFIVPACVAAIFFSAGAVGWVARSQTPSRALRIAWGIIGLGLVALSIAFAPHRLDQIKFKRSSQIDKVEVYSKLEGWLHEPRQMEIVAACRPLYSSTGLFRPYLRYWLDVPPAAVAIDFPVEAPRQGVVLADVRALKDDPARPGVLRRSARLANVRVTRWSKEGRIRRASADEEFALYAASGCGAGVTDPGSSRR